MTAIDSELGIGVVPMRPQIELYPGDYATIVAAGPDFVELSLSSQTYPFPIRVRLDVGAILSVLGGDNVV